MNFLKNYEKITKNWGTPKKFQREFQMENLEEIPIRKEKFQLFQYADLLMNT